MLYNQDWDKPKTAFATVDDLIAWLEKRPADTTYDWKSSTDCLLCRYAGKTSYLESIISMHAANRDLDYATLVYIAKGAPVGPVFVGDGAKAWTYGAALERARQSFNARI